MPDKTPMGPESGVTPHLTVKDGRAAVDFYKKAFGAKAVFIAPAADGKRLMHAHLVINGSSLMLADDFPEHMGGRATPPPAAVTLHLQVKNADKTFAKAVDAGAKVKMPLTDMFWGDRYGQITDPFGHTWSIASTLKGAARKAAMAAAPPPPQPVKKSAKKKAGKH
ncbi:MAG TPA: VOC family protein [Caulobacterales bacterium]|nr:VOC family protein [Caulobacterales bacterium]